MQPQGSGCCPYRKIANIEGGGGILFAALRLGLLPLQQDSQHRGVGRRFGASRLGSQRNKGRQPSRGRPRQLGASAKRSLTGLSMFSISGTASSALNPAHAAHLARSCSAPVHLAHLAVDSCDFSRSQGKGATACVQSAVAGCRSASRGKSALKFWARRYPGACFDRLFFEGRPNHVLLKGCEVDDRWNTH